MKDNSNRKIYGKHIPIQVMLICNLVLQFTAITAKTFSALYVFKLVHVSMSLELRHPFDFWLDYSLPGTARPLLTEN